MKKITFLLSLSALFITNQLTAQENAISENGNVGIGTTTPTARLTVAGSARIDSSLVVSDSVTMASSARVEDDLKVGGNLYIPNVPSLDHVVDETFLVKNADGMVKSFGVASMADFFYSLNCDLVGSNPIWNNGPNKLFTECAGVRVGIGTASPDFTLDVRGDAKTTGHLWANQSISIGADMNAFSKLYVVNPNRTAAIQVNTVGNTKSYQRLMFFEYDNADTKILEVQNTATGNTAFSLKANGEMDIHNGTAPIFHLGTDGKLSLGNGTMQTFQVETTGMIRGRRMKLDLNTWADYVFDENYKLMPLEEVEKFVKQEKHLPNVPSEQALKADGADVMELNKILMEKVEELTLYLIQQNKNTEELKKQLEELQAKLKALENKQ